MPRKKATSNKHDDPVEVALANYRTRYEHWPNDVQSVLSRAVFLRGLLEKLGQCETHDSVAACVVKLWIHAHDAHPSRQRPKKPRKADVQTARSALELVNSIVEWCREGIPDDLVYALDHYCEKPKWWGVPDSATSSLDLYWRDIYPRWWPITGILTSTDLLTFLRERRDHAETLHCAYVANKSIYSADPALETLVYAIQNATEWLHRKGIRGYPNETPKEAGLRALTRGIRSLIEYVETIASTAVGGNADPDDERRIIVDVAAYVVTIDGKPCGLNGTEPIKERVAQFIEELILSNGEFLPRPSKIKTRDIEQQPKPVRDLIEAQPGAGCRIPREKLWLNGLTKSLLGF